MKVYAENGTKSYALKRIENALKEFAPKEIDFTASKEDADLIIFYLWGRLEHATREINYFKKKGKKYAIAQICVRSTRNENTADWLPVWKNAELVWSYFDLVNYCIKDSTPYDFKFYYAPLGIDKDFKRYDVKKEYVIASSGQGYLSESARECIHAAQSVGKKVFHVGPVITKHANVEFSNGMNDMELAKKYSACEFVSGLRRKEGFEMPVIEGLVCGARPVVFDRHDYRHWFGDLAVFIPETSRDGIEVNLSKVFKDSAKPVTDEEIENARKLFNWEKIVNGFWKRIL